MTRAEREFEMTKSKRKNQPQRKRLSIFAKYYQYWQRDELKLLERLAAQNTPIFQIATQMGRTPEAIRNAASRYSVSLAKRR